MLTRPQNTSDKQEFFTGKPIVLEIEVSRPSAKVKWLLNGREIVESNNINITEDGLIRRLTIHFSTPVDSGKYTCDAGDDKIDFQVKVSGKREIFFGRKSNFTDHHNIILSVSMCFCFLRASS